MKKKPKKELKVLHDEVCKFCGEPATYNLQGDGWVLWSLSRTGKYTKQDEWGLGEGDNNDFYCDKCAEEESII